MKTPTITIAPEVKEAILKATRGHDFLDFGKPGSMPAPLYKKVVQVLEQLGIKWDKKRQCHCSPGPISDILDAALSDGKVTDRKKLDKETFQFFPTVPDVARRMAEAAWKAYNINAEHPIRTIDPGVRILEPSFGDGALVRAMALTAPVNPGLNFLGFEIDERHQAAAGELILAFATESRFYVKDFLQTHPDPSQDIVIMNPPFSKGRDIEHIRHALKWLRPGGVCVALSSAGSWTRNTAPYRQVVKDILEMADMKVLEAKVIAGATTDAASQMRLFRIPK